MKNVIKLGFGVLLLLWAVFTSAQTCNYSVTTTPVSCFGGSDGTATIVLPTDLPVTSKCQTPSLPTFNCTNCTVANTATSTGSLTVQNGETFCIRTDGYNKDVTFAGSGTLVICANNVQPQNFNLNTSQPVTIIVLGSVKFQNFNANSNVTIQNYGTIDWLGGLGFNGKLYNNGTIYSRNTFNINSTSGGLYNYGNLYVTLNNFVLDSSPILENYGLIDVAGQTYFNSGTNVANYCTMILRQNVILNAGLIFKNDGKVEVTTETRLNSNATLNAQPNSTWKSATLWSDGILNGQGSTCSKLTITGNATFNSGSVNGRLDVCVSGTTDKRATFASTVTTNCSCTVGSSSITYAWPTSFNAGSKQTVTGIPANTYSVSVTLPGCAPLAKSFTIGTPTQITGTITPGAGILVANFTGGTLPYKSYVWNTGATTSSISFTQRNTTYSVTVTDNNNCTKTISLFVPDCNTSSYKLISNISATTVSLSATGGTAPYTFNWGDGFVGAARNDPPKKIYTITVTDANGCFFSDKITYPCDVDVVVSPPTCTNVGKVKIKVVGVDPTTGSGNGTGNGLPRPLGCVASPVPTESCTSCSNPITQNQTNELVINAGQKVCINATTFTAGIKFETGGELVICGDIKPAYLTFGTLTTSAKITLLGKASIPNLDMRANTTFNNFGTLELTGLAGFNGTLNNYGTISTTGDLNINAVAGNLYNTGTINVKTNFNNLKNSVNAGTMIVEGEFNSNSGGTFNNKCSLYVGANLNNNQPFTNEGFVQVVNRIGLNSNGTFNAVAGSWLTAKETTIDASLTGSGGGCSLFRITGNTIINGSASITGSVDFCDLNGIEIKNVNPATSVTACSCPLVPYDIKINMVAVATTTTTFIPGVTVTWPDGVVSTDLERDLTPGTYTVTIQLPGCAPFTKTFTVLPNANPLQANVRVRDKVAVLTITSGVGPFAVKWPGGTTYSSGSLNTPITKLVFFPNAYTVEVKDANNCSIFVPFTIQGKEVNDTCKKAIEVKVTPKLNLEYEVLGIGDDGTFLYDWSDGVTGNVRTLQKGEKYLVVVRNPAQLCSGNALIDLRRENPSHKLVITSVKPNCGNNNGTIGIAVTGGSGDYTYSVTNTTQQNTPNITGLGTGIYVVTVVDNKTQQSVSETVDFTIVTPALKASVVEDPNTKILTVVPENCNGVCKFNWVEANVATASLNPSLYPNLPSLISVVVEDDCKSPVTITVAIKTVKCASSVTVSNVKPYCGTNGSLSIVNPNPNYKYTWNIPWRTEGTNVQNLSGGRYHLLVTNNAAGNCVVYDDYFDLVAEPALSIASAVYDEVADQLVATVTNGYPVLTYNWNGPKNAASLVLGQPTAGTYTFTVRDGRNCSQTATAVVTFPTCEQNESVIVGGTNVSCYGGNNGTAYVTVANPNGLSYYWHDAQPAYANAVSGLKKGFYETTIIRYGNPTCKLGIYGREVNEPSPLSVDGYKMVDATTMYLNILGGTPEYKVVWTDGYVGQSRSNLPKGRYTVTITDYHNCPPFPYTFDYNPCDLRAYALVQDRNVSVIVTKSVYKIETAGYVWTPNLNNTLSGPVATNLPDNTYTITVTDVIGCSTTLKAIVDGTTNKPCGIDASILPATQATCPEQCDGVLEINLISSLNPVKYIWNGVASLNNRKEKLCVGNYSIQVLDTVNKCAVPFDESITPASPDCPEVFCDDFTSKKLSQSNVACAGKGASGSAEIELKGGVLPITVTWTLPDGTVQTNLTSYNFKKSNLGAGTYVYKATDARKCTTSLSVSITTPLHPLEVSFDPSYNSKPSCPGGADGSAKYTISGGTAPYTLKWKRGTTVLSTTSQSVTGTFVKTGLAIGTYVLEIEDANKCSASNMALVEDNTLKFNGLFANDASACPTTKISIWAEVVPGYTYEWVCSNCVAKADNMREQTGPGNVVLNLKPINTTNTCRSFTDTVKIAARTNCGTGDPENPLCSFTPITEKPATLFDDYCEVLNYTASYMNAKIKYKAYIDDERKNFRERYITKCLAAQETLTLQYTDKEHHYTLFYYDQAGNLARTIPPQGVNLLNQQQVNEAIAARRTSGRVYTAHNYQSTYQYNSLNTPVKQDIPDHDRQAIVSTATVTTAVGLPSTATYTAGTFTSPDKGFVLANANNEGFIYKAKTNGTDLTEAAIVNYEKLNAITLNGTAMYACGDNGNFLASTNSGTTWKYLGVPTALDLHFVHFATSAAGIVLNANGAGFSTVDGGLNWTTTQNNKLNSAIGGANVDDLYFTPGTFEGWAIANGKVYYTADAVTGTWAELANYGTSDASAVAKTTTGYIAYVGKGVFVSDGNLQASNLPSTTTVSEIAVQDPSTIYTLSGDRKTVQKLTKVGTVWKLETFANPIPSTETVVSFFKTTNWYALSNTGKLYGLGVADIASPANFTASKVGNMMSTATNLVLAGKNTSNIAKVYYQTGTSYTERTLTTPTTLTNFKDALVYDAENILAVDNSGTVYFLEKGVKITSAPDVLPVTTEPTFVWTIATGWASVDRFIQGAGKTAWVVYATGSVAYLTYDDVTNGLTQLQRWKTTAVSNTIPLTNLNSISLIAPNVTQVTGYASYNVTTAGNLVQLPATNLNNTFTVSGEAAVAKQGNAYVGTSDGLLFERVSNVWALKDKIQDVAITEMQPDGTDLNVGFATGELKVVTPLPYVVANKTSGETASSVKQIVGNFVRFANNNIRNLATAALVYTASVNGIASNGYGVGASGTNGVIYPATATALGASSFKLPTLNASTAVLGTTTVYSAGELGIVMASQDAGDTWKPKATLVDAARPSFSKIAATASVVRTVDANGKLYVGTANVLVAETVAGTTGTWADVHNYQNNWLAVGNGSKAYYNNGTTWSQITGIPANTSLLAAYVIDATKAFIVGAGNTLLSINLVSKTATNKYINVPTSASGKTWTDVWFSDYQTGMALASDGTQLKTTNGGDTWEDVTTRNTPTPVVGGILIPRSNPDSGLETDMLIVGQNKATTSLHDEADLYGTRNWYDQAGRMVLTQNPKQFYKYAPAAFMAYSYTFFDVQGRIVEVGEVKVPKARQPELEAGLLVTPTFVDYSKFVAWVTAFVRTEVTRTYYDLPTFTVNVNSQVFVQNNTRPHVASVTYSDGPLDPAISTSLLATNYQRATHYNYDIHGNVKELVQQIKLPSNDFLAKLIRYEYDLVSSKVNKASYQPGQSDQYHHRYSFDADNRITMVETSHNNYLWERDVTYKFYAHGPLARSTIGDHEVQGMDYAYTLQEWAKSVNAANLSAANDPGKDGSIGGKTGRDAMGYSLNYYEGDYKSIGSTNHIATTSSIFPAANKAQTDLYSGNMRAMVTSLLDPTTRASSRTQLASYSYDQLNRLRTMQAYRGYDPISNAFSTTSTDAFRNNFEYDLNGNITKQERYDNANVFQDNLSYQYQTPGYAHVDGKAQIRYTNRLGHVIDANTQNTGVDGFLDNQTASNYTYDPQGSVISDRAEQITSVDWTVYGKLRGLSRSASKPDLSYQYDANGYRVAKILKPAATKTDASTWVYTYYVRDASGNVLALYEQSTVNNQPTTVLKEHHVYGNSRLAVRSYQATATSDGKDARPLGLKAYELGNHLGNILAIVSDIPLAQTDGSLAPEILSLSDYYPYGAAMKGDRTFTSSLLGVNGYRYGFNGIEKETDWNGSTYIANERPLDTRLGRWLRVDPELDKFPESSPYAAMDNDPVNKVDSEGDVWNIIAGAIMGAAVDYGMQVAGNLASGKSLSNSLTQVDKTSILISAASGALTSGASAIAATSAKVGVKIAKVAAKEVIEVGEKVVRKAIDNSRAGKPLISGADLKGVVVEHAKEKVMGAGMQVAAKATAKLAKPVVAAVTKNLPSKPNIPNVSVKKSPCGCFTESTLIQTENGLKQIKDIQIGEMVLAYNEKAKTVEHYRVINVFEVYRDSLFKIVFKKEVIEATSDHPFYVGGQWIKARDLKVGDTLTLLGWKKARIDDIRIEKGNFHAYNFEVDQAHTYYVSKSGVLVHNTACDISTGAGRDHVTYEGVKGGKPYVGYASAPSSEKLKPEAIVERRYNGDFSEFGGQKPNVVPGTFGSGVSGKAKARGTEQKIYQENVDKFGKDGVANKQNPVGPNNLKKDSYMKAADTKYEHK